MKNLLLLSLVLSSTSNVYAFGKKTFIDERGNYEFSTQDIIDYKLDNNLNYYSVRQSYPNSVFRVNNRNEFQIKDWFEYDWYSLQKQYTFNTDSYLNFYNASSLNEAKINYYSDLNFDLRKRVHKTNLIFPREWGGLNHPPIMNKIENLEIYAPHYNKVDTDNMSSEFFNPEFHNRIDAISETELSFGNELTILEDKDSYKKKLDLIKNANETILMSSLVFVGDESTDILVDELIKKANEGVEVYVMVENLISIALGHNKNPKRMERSGIKILRATDAFKYEGNAIYHNKMLIVDESVAIVGGQNMLNADNLSNGVDFRNRDIDLMVRGPLVADITKGFLKDYNHFYNKKMSLYKKQLRRKTKAGISLRRQRHKSISLKIKKLKNSDITNLVNRISHRKKSQTDKGERGKEHYNQVLSNPATRMSGVCRFIGQSPYEDGRVIGKTYLEYLDNTKNYLGIQTPEILDTKFVGFRQRRLIEKFDSFKMYNQLHDKLQELGDREGMKMDVITAGPILAGNEIVDMLNEKIKKNLAAEKIGKANFNYKMINFWNNYYGKPHYSFMLKDYSPRKNVRLWNHISFMHSKVFYFDRITASIGSYNLQHNATDHAYENTVICQDKNLNAQLDEVMVRDMANSIPFVFKNVN